MTNPARQIMEQLYQSLLQPTGLKTISGYVQLIPEGGIAGEILFINSGGLPEDFKDSRDLSDEVLTVGSGLGPYLELGENFRVETRTSPVTNEHLRVYPGGALIQVVRGKYTDLDFQERAIRKDYISRHWVYYAPWGSHRRQTHPGTVLTEILFDGVISSPDPFELLKSMSRKLEGEDRTAASKQAIDYFLRSQISPSLSRKTGAI